jgi:hypothetical protein
LKKEPEEDFDFGKYTGFPYPEHGFWSRFRGNKDLVDFPTRIHLFAATENPRVRIPGSISVHHQHRKLLKLLDSNQRQRKIENIINLILTAMMGEPLKGNVIIQCK